MNKTCKKCGEPLKYTSSDPDDDCTCLCGKEDWQDEIQEDTTSMEEKLVAIDEHVKERETI